MPRFNVGDRVRVARVVATGEWGYWNPIGMSPLIGQEVTISGWCGPNGRNYHEGQVINTYRIVEEAYYWPEDAFEPIEVVAPPPPPEKFAIIYGTTQTGADRGLTYWSCLQLVSDTYEDAVRRAGGLIGRECHIVPLRSITKINRDGSVEDYR